MIDFIYNNLKEHYEYPEGLKLTSAEAAFKSCSLCDRLISNTAEPSVYYNEKNSYSIREIRCKPCQTLYIGNKPFLGHRMRGVIQIAVHKDDISRAKSILQSVDTRPKEIESQIKKNTKTISVDSFKNKMPTRAFYIEQNEPIFIKNHLFDKATKLRANSKVEALTFLKEQDGILSEDECIELNNEFDYELLTISKGNEDPHILGMNVGLGMIVSEDKTEFYAPGKHFQKMCATSNQPFKVNAFGGFKVIIDAIENYAETRPLLLILSFGKVKERLIKNLTLTTHKESLHVCSDSELETVNIALYNAMNEAFLGMTYKQVHRVIDTFKQYIQGHLSASEIAAQAEDYPVIFSIAPKLPSDPHEALFTLQVVNAKQKAIK